MVVARRNDPGCTQPDDGEGGIVFEDGFVMPG
jgi:hypothetical protein